MRHDDTPTTPTGPSRHRAYEHTPDSGDGPPEGSALASDHGRTVVADSVVAKIAGIAAREVAGVSDLGAGTARAVGQLRGRLRGGRANLSQGVAVEVGDTQAAIDLDVVVDYGAAIADVSARIRDNVIAAVERMTGLEVTEVNVTIHDVRRLDDREDDPGPDQGGPGG